MMCHLEASGSPHDRLTAITASLERVEKGALPQELRRLKACWREA